MSPKILDRKGMALVFCLLIMTVASMIGIGIATDSSIDGQISRNQRNINKDFFIADGTNSFKQAEILNDINLAPENLDKPEVKLDGSTEEALPNVENLATVPEYNATIEYLFRRHISAGFSIENSERFKFYYYTTKTHSRRNSRNSTGIKTTEKKLGI